MRRLPTAFRWLEPLLQRRRFWIDDDRYVDWLSQTLLRYHEGGRSVLAGYEDGGKGEIVVFPGQIGPWEPARAGEAAPDDAERERIIAAIRDASARHGMVVADTAEIMPPETGIAAIEDWNERRRG